MRAVTWQGVGDVRVEEVPDPKLLEPNDAVIRVTSTAICGSDLHLYGPLGVFMEPGDILGHEAMGVVEEVGPEVGDLRVGDRVVVPFNISCGGCHTCSRSLYSQCETTQVRQHGKGGALFGYTKLYGQVPGGQAEYLRVPQAQFGPVKVPEGADDERFLFLSDVLPTAWQAVEYAGLRPGGSVAVLGLGPIGQLCARIARHRGAERVFGVDREEARLRMAARYGVETVDFSTVEDVAGYVVDRTEGRGPDAVIDAVGLEAHGDPFTERLQRAAGVLPGRLGERTAEQFGVDRLAALHTAIAMVRRGGTVSVTGVYGGRLDPLPMIDLFDKGLTLRMGQANVRAWTDLLLPLVAADNDPLGVLDLATHRLPLADAALGYQIFQAKRDGAVKVVLAP